MLRSQLNAIDPTLSGSQSLLQRTISNAETHLCPLGTGGVELTLCSLSGPSTCDLNRPVSRANVCNPQWNGAVVAGFVDGLRSPGLVLSNGTATQEVAVNPVGEERRPFAFLVLPQQAYNIAVAQQPQDQVCSVTNGRGNSGSTGVSGIAIMCVSAWTQSAIPAGARSGIAAASSGSKAYFAGGYPGGGRRHISD